MSEQPTPPAEPASSPVQPPAPPAPQEATGPPPSAGLPPAAPPPAAPPPPAPPLYAWQQPAEPVGPAPGILFAGYGARLVAWIIDGIVVAVATIAVSVVLLVFVGLLATSGSDAAAVLTALAWFVAILVITFGYFPYFWTRGGQTPGMRMMRIRVVRDRDGGPVSGGQAVLRLIGYWVSGAVFYLGYIWVFFDARRRGWHDLIAGTVVIEA